MQAGILKALLAHVPDATEVYLDLHDFDTDLVGISYNEQYGNVFLIALEDGPDDDEVEDESCGDTCGIEPPFDMDEGKRQILEA